MNLILRETKGTPLTHEEMDNNFKYNLPIYNQKFNNESINYNLDLTDIDHLEIWSDGTSTTTTSLQIIGPEANGHIKIFRR